MTRTNLPHDRPALPSWVARGMPVHDTKQSRIGIIHGIGDPVRFSDDPLSHCVWLLPPGGGFEWRATIDARKKAYPGQWAKRGIAR